MPRRAHRLAQHTVSLFTVYEAFFRRVPAQFGLEHHSDISEVADGCRTVSDFHTCGCLLTVLNAIDKIAMMVIALIQVNLVRADHRCFQRFRIMFSEEQSLLPLPPHLFFPLFHPHALAYAFY